VGDVCDNCPLFPNHSQSDKDGDDEGDICDLDDGWFCIYFESAGVVHWQNEAGYDLWNVYRGDLDVLKSEGLYAQLPGSNPIAGRLCHQTGDFAEDAIPNLAPGKVAFYLVTSYDMFLSETGLGYGSDWYLRTNTYPCPRPTGQ
jgi:hypothetical protein